MSSLSREISTCWAPLMHTDLKLSLCQLYFQSTSVCFSMGNRQASQTPFPPPKALQYSSFRSLLTVWPVPILPISGSAVPVMKYFECHPHMPALCLLHDFGFCTNLLSKYISYLLLYSSASPARTLVIWSVTVYPQATALEMSSLSVPSVVPWPQALPGVLTDCSVTGSLAICSFGPPPCCSCPCHPLFHQCPCWYSASRAISHITYITYLSAPALGLRHVTRDQEVGLGSEVQIHTL